LITATGETKCSCSALFLDAEQKCMLKKVEVDRNKNLKSSNTKCFKLTVHCFFEKVNKNGSAVMFPEIHTYN
jgi:hypothetical protein